jgi:threonine dehydrogenase-like Zn-dependent dehydrogenase
MRFLGSASRFPHVQGMFQEYFVMGERQCYPVPATSRWASSLSQSRSRRSARSESRRRG